MARISKSNTYAILWLNSQGETVTNISKELNLNESQISDILKKHNNQTNEKKEGVQTTSEPVSNKYKSKDLMITDTVSKTRKVAIMTKEASEINDTFKKNNVPPVSSKMEKNIFRPLDK